MGEGTCAAALLRSGKRMPCIGFGTWNVRKNVKHLIKHAINTGYRHIDCAAIYENEKDIGEAFQYIFSNPIEFKVSRSDVLSTITCSRLTLLGVHHF